MLMCRLSNFFYLFLLLYLPLTQNLMVLWQGLTPYEKKKYVWKMLYIYMLGYDVDFGHMEAVSLISAPKYPEKQVIYLSNFVFQFVWKYDIHFFFPSGFLYCDVMETGSTWTTWIFGQKCHMNVCSAMYCAHFVRRLF